MSSGYSWPAGRRRRAKVALVMLPIIALCGSRTAGDAAPVQPEAVPTSPPAEQTHPDRLPPEWTESKKPRRFVGQDLFNHIDGAAELFLEVGFREVLVRQYRNADATLTQEVYEMKDPTAARAMYLRFRGKGTAVDGVAGRNVGNRYQVTAQKDRYFVQVTNLFGQERCLSAMVTLVNQVLAGIPDDGAVTLTDLLPAEGLVPGSETIVCGPYSLQSIFTLGEGDILQLQPERCGIAGDYVTEPAGGFTRLIVAYRGGDEARAAFQHLQRGLDSELEVVRQDDQTLVFRDADSRFGSVSVTGDKLEIRLHLARDPIDTDQPEQQATSK